MVDCPCGYAKNVKEDKCPICGTDLTPLHHLEKLPEYYYQRALIEYDEKNFDEALNLLQTAIGLKPDYSEAYIMLAKVYKEKKLYNEALRFLYEFLKNNNATDENVKSEIEEIEKMLKKNNVIRRYLPILATLIIFLMFIVYFLFRPSVTSTENKDIFKNITIHYRVLFDSNSYNIKPEYKDILDEINNYIVKYPNMLIRIEGYSDGIGNPSYNYKLSQKRAEAVAKYILEYLKNFDVSFTPNITVKWFGQISFNKDDNSRRVDIYLESR